MTDEELSRAIDLAFANVPIPDPEHIAASVGPEGQYVQSFFPNKNWKDITLDVLKKDYPGPHSACLEFMTPEAFVYFFPAYLKIAALSYFEGDMLSVTVCSLLQDGAEGRNCSATGAIDLFNDAQNKVISQVLDKISKEYETDHSDDYFNCATNALKLRWGKYLNK